MMCIQCGSEMIMQVQLYISCPSDLFLKIRKADLRKKDVQIIGANWDKARFICKCGNMVNEYGEETR